MPDLFFTQNNKTPSNAALSFQFFIENIFKLKLFYLYTQFNFLHTRDLKQSIFKLNNSCGKPLAVQLSGPYREKPDRSARQPIRLHDSVGERRGKMFFI